MGNTSIKKTEIHLEAQDVEKLPELIGNELVLCYDSLIFISKALYFEIKRNFHEHNILPHDYIDGEGFDFKESPRKISRIGFRDGCRGYMQISQFQTSLINYSYEKSGIMQVIFIY